jgi:hypothetical protein
VYYPDIEALRKEDEQPEPYLLFTITDASGEVVRHLKAPAKKGLKRIVWDFRYNTSAPARADLNRVPTNCSAKKIKGYLALPGRYSVTLSKFEDGVLSTLAGPVSFEAKSLNNATLPAADKQAYLDFCKKVSRLRKAVSAANIIRNDLNTTLGHVQTALHDMPAPPQDLLKKAYDISRRLNVASTQLNGDRSLARREFETPPSLGNRVGLIEDGMWNSTSAPTETYQENYRIASKQLGPLLSELKAIAQEIEGLQRQLEVKGAPATPGRWPEWKE